jgi:hypothetical protein
MTVAAGLECYNIDTPPVAARGCSYTAAELDAALDGPVRELVNDIEGGRRIRELLEGVSQTHFQKDRLEQILNADPEPEDWEVGEALAETYVTTHRSCTFPWPDKWDQRKSRSSLPGADLAGLQETEHRQHPFRFAFGEVKTSGENAYPPGNMHGRHGLKQQLEDLRDTKPIRDTLFRYLALRAVGTAWEAQFRSAASRYLADHTDVAVFGVLIRDVPPHENDLKARSQKLANGRPVMMRIDLLAIYMPAGSIARLGTFYRTSGEGGDARH